MERLLCVCHVCSAFYQYASGGGSFAVFTRALGLYSVFVHTQRTRAGTLHLRESLQKYMMSFCFNVNVL